MKRFLIPAMMLALFAPISFTGCAEKSEVTSTDKVETPEGSKTVETTQTIEKTGDAKTNPE